jgi:hypothetical protein
MTKLFSFIFRKRITREDGQKFWGELILLSSSKRGKIRPWEYQ